MKDTSMMFLGQLGQYPMGPKIDENLKVNMQITIDTTRVETCSWVYYKNMGVNL